MNNFLKLNKDDMNTIINNVAVKKGIPKSMIEKDYWACFILNFLFSKSSFKDLIAFKGGTSLSKCYGLINRFSEDLDILLNYSVINITEEEMNLKRSKTQQDIFCKNAISKTVEYLKNTFVQTLKRELEQELECDINLVLKDNGDVLFYYPQQHEDSYLLKEVKLEIGVLSAWTPSEIKDAKPFVYDFYPQLFETDFANILVLSPVRTFWDKILILHAEAHRQTDIPMRYSRHYYDIYQLCNSKFKELAFNDLGLLTQVREYKSKYYYSSWANYNTAKPGSLRLLPNEANLLLLEKDYKDMQSMLYGENPTFKEIIELLKKLEIELNSL